MTVSDNEEVTEYARRNLALSEMGYTSYRQYLRSTLWGTIRAAKLTRDPQCYGCGKERSLQVHHEVYSKEVLMGETLVGLFTACRRCHQWIEFTRDGYKRDPKQATDELKRLHKLYFARPRVKNDIRKKALRKAAAIRAKNRKAVYK